MTEVWGQSHKHNPWLEEFHNYATRIQEPFQAWAWQSIFFFSVLFSPVFYLFSRQNWLVYSFRDLKVPIKTLVHACKNLQSFNLSLLKAYLNKTLAVDQFHKMDAPTM